MIDTLAFHPDPYPAYAQLRARGVHQHADGRWVIARARDVTEVLSCPAAVVGFQRAGPLAAIQAAMARFSDGADHDRRRALTCDHLRTLSPSALRGQARELASARLDGLHEVEVMEHLARWVPVAVLARALGMTDVDRAVAATRHLCLALAPPAGVLPSPDDDLLAGTLRRLIAPVIGERRTDEHVASVVAVLFQAMDATAGLIGNAVVAAHRHGTHDAETLVAQTNQYDPSVQLTTRVAAAPVQVAQHTIPTGDRMAIMLAAANHDDHAGGFAFGVGLRPCPGDAHALALATGVLEALSGARMRLTHDEIVYERRANLRIPAHLTVRL